MDPAVIADLREQDARNAYLDYLYRQDGRNDPAHPLHARFTGLVQDRAQALLAAERAELFWGQ